VCGCVYREICKWNCKTTAEYLGIQAPCFVFYFILKNDKRKILRGGHITKGCFRLLHPSFFCNFQFSTLISIYQFGFVNCFTRLPKQKQNYLIDISTLFFFYGSGTRGGSFRIKLYAADNNCEQWLAYVINQVGYITRIQKQQRQRNADL